jgi:tRNA-2-methylthio-N6-dimethylallyladenosine synthase
MPTLCDHVHLPVQSGSARVLKMMAREYTPEWYLERIAWIKAARRPISLSTDIIVGISRRDCGRLHPDHGPAGRGRVRLRLRVQVLGAAEYAGAGDHDRFDSGCGEGERLQVLLDRQREIQRVNYAKHLGQIMEVMVEGQNPARGQVTGRSSQNKPVNFTCAADRAGAGSYLQVKITATHPNSLVWAKPSKGDQSDWQVGRGRKAGKAGAWISRCEFAD